MLPESVKPSLEHCAWTLEEIATSSVVKPESKARLAMIAAKVRTEIVVLGFTMPEVEKTLAPVESGDSGGSAKTCSDGRTSHRWRGGNTCTRCGMKRGVDNG